MDNFIRDFFHVATTPKVIRAVDSPALIEFRRLMQQVEQDSAKTDDSALPKSPILNVDCVATFSGRAINHRVYTGKEVRKATPSWTNTYQRPICLHHKSGMGMFDEPADPIGRAQKASYKAYLSGKDWDNDWDPPSSMGSGHVDVNFNVTDIDAISKVLDGRYQTLSVGFTVQNRLCSICKKDWLSEGCDHEPGRKYKLDKKSPQKTCYLIPTGIDYKELSFVNVPAAVGAQVTNIKLLQDSIDEDLRRGGEICVPPTKILLRQIAYGDSLFDIIDPADREVIEIKSDTAATTTRTDSGSDKIMAEEQTPETIEAAATDQAPAEEQSEVEDQIQTETATETTEFVAEDKKAEPAAEEPAAEEPAPEKDEQATDVSEYTAQIEALKETNKILVEENQTLANRVVALMADKLLDLRIHNAHPSVRNKDRNELLEQYKTRSIESLQDAIDDENVEVVAEEKEQDSAVESAVEEKPQEKEITEEDMTNKEETVQAIGTIRSSDVGLIADLAQDEQTAKVQTRTSPSDMRKRMIQLLKG